MRFYCGTTRTQAVLGMTRALIVLYGAVFNPSGCMLNLSATTTGDTLWAEGAISSNAAFIQKQSMVWSVGN